MIRTPPLILALFLALVGSAHASSPQNVLVMHTFHQGWQRTDQINEGIQSVFSPFADSANLYFEYLDQQRNPDRKQMADLVPLLQAKLRKRRFAVAIVAGEGALFFMRRYGHLLAPDAPVVFCDVDRAPAAAAHPGRETGCVSHPDHLATLKLMLQLHPDTRRIVILSDAVGADIDTVVDLTRAVDQVAPYAEVDHWRRPDLKELPARLVGLVPGDLIYLPGFDAYRLAQVRYAEKSADLIARWSPVAAYSDSEFFLGKGIAGGAIDTGRRQGEMAAQMAMRLLSGTRIEAIPVLNETPPGYLFDGKVLHKLGVNPDKLPPGSQVIDPLPGFLVRHKAWLPRLMAGVALLLAGLISLIIHQNSRRRDLKQTNMELDGRIRERTAHLQLANQRLKKQAITDPVTNLANRRFIQQRYAEEFKKAQRYSQPMTLMLLDVDGFKTINSEHGYVLAEKVLRDVGRAIRRSIREVDLAGRFGGESFMVLLPNTDVDQGGITAERIRKNAAGLRWHQGKVRITLSVALVQFRGHSPTEMLEMADCQLKAAKSTGGDRIMVFRIGAETPDHPPSDHQESN